MQIARICSAGCVNSLMPLNITEVWVAFVAGKRFWHLVAHDMARPVAGVRRQAWDALTTYDDV